MKKIALLLPLLVLPIIMNAQKSPVDKLFEKYYGAEGFTTVLVTPEMFEVIAKMEKSGGDLDLDMDGVFKKINRVRVIAQEDDATSEQKVNFMEEMKGVKFDDYEELVVVKESDQEVLVLAKEEDGRIRELLVLVGGDENVLVSIEGKFTMDDLEELSDLEGLDALDGIL